MTSSKDKKSSKSHLNINCHCSTLIWLTLCVLLLVHNILLWNAKCSSYVHLLFLYALFCICAEPCTSERQVSARKSSCFFTFSGSTSHSLTGFIYCQYVWTRIDLDPVDMNHFHSPFRVVTAYHHIFCLTYQLHDWSWGRSCAHSRLSYPRYESHPRVVSVWNITDLGIVLRNGVSAWKCKSSSRQEFQLIWWYVSAPRVSPCRFCL